MNAPARSRSAFPAVLFGVTAMLALGACSQQQGASAPAAPSASAQAAANEAKAAKEFDLYKKMLAEHNIHLAAALGTEIVKKYPDTSAAAEVNKKLPKLQATAKAKAEHDRLANLWYYQTANVEGLQHTASIYADGHRRTDLIRLVLRRHVKWGLSVYLFGNGHGFVCKHTCHISMHFDDKHRTWSAYRPPTGEPALMFKHEKRFIRDLKKAKVITMDVTTKDHGKQTLKFEVGGYDPAKFKPLPKK